MVLYRGLFGNLSIGFHVIKDYLPADERGLHIFPFLYVIDFFSFLVFPFPLRCILRQIGYTIFFPVLISINLFTLSKIVIGFKSTFTMYNGKNNKQKLSCFP